MSLYRLHRLIAVTAVVTLAASLACSSATEPKPAPLVPTLPSARPALNLDTVAVCGEAACVPVTQAYISHFTAGGCTGTESYYTAYEHYDGVKRTWDGNGVVGTTLRRVTNRSYKDYNGICYDAWPEGNTLSDFVTVYRSTPSAPGTTPTAPGSPGVPLDTTARPCGETGCTAIRQAYISHFTGAGCTGTESYYTAYNGYDGVRRSWDGHGTAGTRVHAMTNRSYRDAYGTCYDAWPSGNTLPDFVTVYRDATTGGGVPPIATPVTPPAPDTATAPAGPCAETVCTAIRSAYISHFTGAGCTGRESYYTAYYGYDGVRRSWNGTGTAGGTLRTVTNRSYRDASGTCYDAWPSGNTLTDFVTVYR